jgi:hypothetical protein
MHDIGITESGQPFLVMDYVAGENLAQLVEKQRLPLNDAIDIFAQVCDGLSHAHARNVVHRDIKPSNIIIQQSADGEHKQAKIFDFGIAKVLSDTDSDNKLTQTGEIFGSPLYMSPEQCQGFASDNRADIYSLGCVIYETISGKPPLQGASALETLRMHISETPQSISAANPDLNLPTQLDALLAKALAKNPRERYQAADDLKFDLQLLKGANVGDFKVVPRQSRALSKQNSRFFTPVTHLDLGTCLEPGICASSIIILVACISWFSVPAVTVPLLVVGVAGMLFSVLVFGGKIVWPTREDQALHLIPQHLRSVNRLVAQNLANAGTSNAPLEGEQLGPLLLGGESGSGLHFHLSSTMRAHNPHTLLVGTNGSGKTRMMAQLIASDMSNAKHSVVVIDRDGELTEQLVNHIGEKYGASLPERLTIINPSNSGSCAGFNPLLLKELDLTTRADIIATGFRAAHTNLALKSERWAEQTTQLLRFAVITLGLNRRTLNDLVPLLTDADLKRALIKQAEENQHELPTGIFAECSKPFEQLYDTNQWDKQISPILDVAMPASSHHLMWPVLVATDNNLDLFDILRQKKIILFRIPEAQTGSQSDLAGSILVSALLQSIEHIYANTTKLNACALYIDRFETILDFQLLSQILSRQNDHLKIALSVTTRSIEQLPLNCRDLLLGRVGLLCAFRVLRPDAGLIARRLAPAESVYVGSAEKNFLVLQDTINQLMNQEPRQYILCLREATAGVFQMRSPSFPVN